MIPEYTKNDLDAYAKEGQPLGGFLRAVVNNDLKGAFERADENNKHAMFDILCYLYNHCPISCWGRTGAYKEWMERKGKEEVGKNPSLLEDDEGIVDAEFPAT